MPDQPDSESKRDEVLRRMLKTPPKPHKVPAKTPPNGELVDVPCEQAVDFIRRLGRLGYGTIGHVVASSAKIVDRFIPMC